MLFLGLITIITSVMISSVAAYYSIYGLIAIFSAAKIEIMVMGIVLEIGKIISTSWLYRSWKTSPIILKLYLIFAILVLMFITSMGIFGFLSKANIDQNSSLTIYREQLEFIDKKISYERNNIDMNTRQLEILNTSLEEYFKLGAISKGLSARSEQESDRTKLTSSIEISNNKILEYERNKNEINIHINEITKEIGPIKYISDLIFSSSTDDLIEKSIRYVIIIIVFVFDPLAMALLIAGNFTIKNYNNIMDFSTFLKPVKEEPREKKKKPRRERDDKGRFIKNEKTQVKNNIINTANTLWKDDNTTTINI